jgi:hypothetical protein
VAKKRKSSRPSRGTRKTTSRKKKTSVATRRASSSKRARTGLESTKQVDFRPLKAQIRAHIARLSTVQEPSSAVQSALQSLRQVQNDLTVECSPTMVLQTS